MLKPGQIITEFKTKKSRDIIVRVVDKNDAKKLMDFINLIFSEDTFSLHGPKDLIKSLKEEQQYLRGQLKKIKNKEGVHLVAECKGRIIGSVEIRRGQFRCNHQGEIGIMVNSDFREEGVGQKLLELVINEANNLSLKALYLYCFANNHRAIHVYEKMGFSRVGLLPKAFAYKDDYIDSVAMYREL